MKHLFDKKIFFGLLLVVLSLVFVRDAQAAPFQQAAIRYDRMKAQSPTTLQVVFVPKSTNTENKVKLIFSGMVIGTGTSATTAPAPSGATALPGTLTVTGAGTSIVLTGVGDLTVGTTYAFNISAGISTPASANQYLDTLQTLTVGDSVIDATTVASRVISDDQVVLSANVPPSFSFVLNGNTDAFTADLDPTAVRATTGRTVTITTNANKGWIAWAMSNGALSSATTGETIPTTGTINASPDTCSIGVDCYLLGVGTTSNATGVGTATTDAEYVTNGTTSGGTLSKASTGLVPIASRPGKTAGDTLVLRAYASILGTKAAASDYTDTLTIVGAGTF